MTRMPGDAIDNGLLRLCSSNSPPTPVEATLSQVRVKALTAKVKTLRLELQEAEEELSQHQCVLAPIRRVPPEILGEIFGWAVPTYYRAFCHYREALNALTLVCKAWHEAAHATHRLWADIREGTIIRGNPSFDRFPMWFSKAKGAPKSLHLTGIRRNDCRCHESTTSDSDCPRNHPALIEFLAVGPPLHHLEIACSTSKCFDYFLKSIHAFPSDGVPRSWLALRSLDLFVGLEYSNPEYVADPRTLLSRLLPALSTLRLQFTTQAHQFDIPQRVLQDLTSFALACPWDAPRVLDILRHCTKVEHLEIDLSQEKYPNDGSSPTLERTGAGRIHLPRIRNLEVSITDGVEARNILRSLHVPALKTLSINYIHEPEEREPALWGMLASLDVVSLAQNESPEVTLQSLRIHEYDDEPPSMDTSLLLNVLSHIPTLSEFALDGVTFSASAFLEAHRRRVQEDGAYALLPSIQRIRFEDYAGDFDMLPFLQYLKERYLSKQTSHRRLEGHHKFQDSLRRVEFSYHRSEITLFHQAYTAAQPVILELEQEYGIVVDVFVS